MSLAARQLVRSYDPATTALCLRMTAPPSGQRRFQINRLIRSLKSAGIWDKLDILYVLAAHDAQAARLNWKGNASFGLTAVNSPTFTADRGYAGDGSSSYLLTNWDPATNGSQFTQDSATLFGWSRTSAAEPNTTNYWIGLLTGSSNRLTPRTSADLFSYRVNTTTAGTTVANTNGSGLIAASRTASTVTQSYRNGAALGAAGSVASTALSNVDMCVGRGNSTFSAAECAAMGLGAGLNATEHAALYTALNTYLTAIGAA